MKRAVATFTNETYDEEPYDEREGAHLGRAHIIRRFAGDIEGQSTAELLTAMIPGGSAIYLGLDRISARIGSREGSFVLQHGGQIGPEGSTSWGKVLPDSGTGALAGLRGESEISVDEDGTHRLTLDYELGE